VLIFVKIGVEPTLKLRNPEFLVLNQDLKLQSMKNGVGNRPKMMWVFVEKGFYTVIDTLA